MEISNYSYRSYFDKLSIDQSLFTFYGGTKSHSVYKPEASLLTVDVIRGFVLKYLIENYDLAVPIPEFHEMMWRIVLSPYPFIAIGAPRGHAKTTAITHAYGLASLLFRESDFCLLISDTETQAIMYLEEMKNELTENEELKKDFGIKGLIIDSQTLIVCELNDGYKFRVQVRGAEQKVRGLKWRGRRPNLLLCHCISSIIFDEELESWMKVEDHPTAKVIKDIDCVEVLFSDGQTEIVANWHVFAIIADGEVKWCSINDLQLGDYVYAPSGSDSEEGIQQSLLSETQDEAFNASERISRGEQGKDTRLLQGILCEQQGEVKTQKQTLSREEFKCYQSKGEGLLRGEQRESISCRSGLSGEESRKVQSERPGLPKTYFSAESREAGTRAFGQLQEELCKDKSFKQALDEFKPGMAFFIFCKEKGIDVKCNADMGERSGNKEYILVSQDIRTGSRSYYSTPIQESMWPALGGKYAIVNKKGELFKAQQVVSITPIGIRDVVAVKTGHGYYKSLSGAISHNCDDT